MKRANVALALYFLVVFACGGVAGFFTSRLYQAKNADARPHRRPSPEEYRNRYMEEMKSRLKLNEDQVKALAGILDQTRERFRVANERIRPELKAIQDEQVAQISAILTDAQKQEYGKMREEREKRMKGPRGGPPPGR